MVARHQSLGVAGRRSPLVQRYAPHLHINVHGGIGQVDVALGLRSGRVKVTAGSGSKAVGNSRTVTVLIQVHPPDISGVTITGGKENLTIGKPRRGNEE